MFFSLDIHRLSFSDILFPCKSIQLHLTERKSLKRKNNTKSTLAQCKRIWRVHVSSIVNKKNDYVNFSSVSN